MTDQRVAQRESRRSFPLRRAGGAGIAFLALALCGAASAQPTEQAVVFCRSGQLPMTATAVGDVNGDGVADVAVRVLNDPDANGAESVALVSGKSGAPLWTIYDYTEGGGYGAAIGGVGDVNGDGVADLVVQAAGNVLEDEFPMDVLSGATGAVLFTFEAVRYGPILVTGDASEDGVADLVILSNGTNDVTSYSGKNGKARWSVATSPYHEISLAGDTNGDGALDLLVEAQDHSFQVLSSASGVVLYDSKSKAAAYAGHSRWVAVGDVTGDDHPDFIGRDENLATTLFSGKNGVPVWSGASEAYETALAGDFDCDQRPDLLVRTFLFEPGEPIQRLVTVYSSKTGGPVMSFPQLGDVAGMPAPMALDDDPTPDLLYVTYLAGADQTCVNRVENPCGGRVTWTSGAPIQGAVIEAYYLSGDVNDPIAKPIPPLAGDERQVTDVDGHFEMPPELFEAPKFSDESKWLSTRGLRARVTYTEDTGTAQTEREVVNYVEWNPLRPFWKGIKGNETILFPYPVVFQPGVWGQINGGSADALRSFLQHDAGGDADPFDPTNWSTLKRGKASAPQTRIPSFLFFGMPSSTDECLDPFTSGWNDGVDWGYHNCPYEQTERRFRENAARLEAHITTRIRAEIAQLTPDDVDDVAIHLLAHSYGGVIARAYLRTKQLWPPVDRFVSFDVPHGGTAKAPWLSPFSEEMMNGIAFAPYAAPTIPGWNHVYGMSTSASHLLFSSSDETVLIDPTPTALGVGRTQRPKYALSPLGILWPFTPNGHCSRAIGGLELLVPGEGHSIQNVVHVMVTTARYLVTPSFPTLGSPAQPGAPITQAALSGPPEAMCSGGALTLGEAFFWFKKLKALKGLTSSSPLPVPTGGQVRVRGYLSGDGASLKVRDATGQLVPKSASEGSALAGAAATLEEVWDLPAGMWSLELAAGASDADARIEVHYDDGLHAAVGVDPAFAAPGQPVLLQVSLRGGDGTVIPGAAATAWVRSSDGADTEVPLFDDGQHGDGLAGDGVFAASLAGGLPFGRYQVRATVDATVNGLALGRSGVAAFAVSGAPAAITGVAGEVPIDADDDGLAEAIEVGLLVQSQGPGTYRIVADLDHQGTLVQSVEGGAVFEGPGVQTVALSIPSSVFHQQGSGQGWNAASILLFDEYEALPVGGFSNLALKTYPLEGLALPAAPAPSAWLGASVVAAAGESLTLFGSHLDEVDEVRIGDLPATIEARSASALRVALPVLAMSGPASVRLITPWHDVPGPSLFVSEPVDPEIDAEVRDGDRVVGTLDVGEVHRCRIELPAGATLSLSAKRKGGGLAPALRLIGPPGLEIVGASASVVSAKKAKIAAVPAPMTGQYVVEILDLSGSGGAYQLDVVAEAPPSLDVVVGVAPGLPAPELVLDAIPGLVVKKLSAARQKAKGPYAEFDGAPSKLSPAVPVLLDPSGAPIDLAGAGAKIKASAKKVTVSKLTLDGGEHRLRIEGVDATSGWAKVSVKVALPAGGATIVLP